MLTALCGGPGIADGGLYRHRSGTGYWRVSGVQWPALLVVASIMVMMRSGGHSLRPALYDFYRIADGSLWP